MKDYSKGKIYRLICDTTDKQYIGSTVQSLSQRLGIHKSAFKRFMEGKTTKSLTAFNILHENNFKIVLIEEYPCNTINELERRERHFIETMKCVNKNKPAQTKEEKDSYNKIYREEPEHGVKMVQYQKQYRQDNVEKARFKTECECGGHFQHKNKTSHFKSVMHSRWVSTTPETP
jgi:hypothetical protein